MLNLRAKKQEQVSG